MKKTVSDLRFALRGLVRRPLAAAVAVATLSLGLASVTATGFDALAAINYADGAPR